MLWDAVNELVNQYEDKTKCKINIDWENNFSYDFNDKSRMILQSLNNSDKDISYDKDNYEYEK